jgi:hypothetical protein
MSDDEWTGHGPYTMDEFQIRTDEEEIEYLNLDWETIFHEFESENLTIAVCLCCGNALNTWVDQILQCGVCE